MIVMSRLLKLIGVFCLPALVSCATPPPAQGPDDILFFFVEKAKNYRQSAAGELTVEDYGFLASVFGTGKGRIESAAVILPGNGRKFALQDAGRMYAFGKDHYASIEALNAEFPDGEYRVAIKSEHNAIADLPLILRGKGSPDDYPPAPQVQMSQDGMQVRWDRIDPTKDLDLGWTPFATGKADPRKVLDDLIIVLTHDCKGSVVGSSGLPFTARYLTFSDNRYTIKAGTLRPGVPYAFQVEHIRNADTARQGNVPGLAVYVTITTVKVQTTGTAVDAACAP